MNTVINKQKKNVKRSVFYYGMLLIPVLQFCLFYVYVNFDSFCMAFTKFDYDSGRFVFVGAETIKEIFHHYTTFDARGSTGRSALLLIANLLIGIPLPIVFSYYLYKKSFGYKFFKVMLFLPSMISAIVMSTIFRYFMDEAVSAIGTFFGKDWGGLLFFPNSSFPIVMFYVLWMSMGSQIILYSGAMSAISESVVEAGALDGIKRHEELFYIIIPSIWSTIITFIVMKVASTFVDMMSLYDFYGGSAHSDIMTVGYFLYSKINSSTTTFADYPYLSGLGLFYTAITLPCVIILNAALNKWGPRED